jgi:putative flippase GtrA
MVTFAYGGRMRPVLPGRWQKLLHEVSKFGTIGAVNTVLNYAVFNLLALTIFKDGQLKANVAATVVATTSSYFMNRHWTYRDRPKSTLRREYALFFLFNLAGMMIELGVLAMAKYGLGITTLVALNVAKGFGLGLGMVFRFWTYRTIVFRAAPPPGRAASAPTRARAARTRASAILARATHARRSTATFAEPAPAIGVAQVPVAAEFAQLTEPLERELDPPLDPAIRAELDIAGLGANRARQSVAGPAPAEG